MTETAGEVVQDILQELLVQGAEADLVADEVNTTIRYMNRYMTMLAADGINLGYTKVTSTADQITIADGALMGLIKNVAVKLATQYDVPVSAQLYADANEGYNVMCKLGADLQPMGYGGTLPIGSGNEWHGHNYGRFYDREEESILAENNQNILVEDDGD